MLPIINEVLERDLDKYSCVLKTHSEEDGAKRVQG